MTQPISTDAKTIPTVHQSSNPADPVVLAGDIGGTTSKFRFVYPSGEMAPLSNAEEVYQIPSRVEYGPDGVIEPFYRAAEDLGRGNNFEVSGIGAAAAGFISNDGIVRHSGNYSMKWRELHFAQQPDSEEAIASDPWRDAHLRELLQNSFDGKFTTLENDANAALLGEYFELRKRHPELAERTGVMYTIGTGLGGAIVLNSDLVRGDHGVGAELGHVPVSPVGPSAVKSSVNIWEKGIQCGCGCVGCAEQFTNLGFIKREFEARSGELDPSHPLLRLSSDGASKQVLSLATEQNDKFSKSIIADQAFNLGRAAWTMTNVLNPSYFILGGGITDRPKILPLYKKNFLKGYGERDFPIEVFFAAAGENAGALGAGLSNLHQNPDFESPFR